MPERDLAAIWVYLSTSPLLGLTITLVAYNLAVRIYRASNSNPLLNPVVSAIALLIVFLFLTDTPYETYFAGSQYIHFLLGPATVALAVPLYQQVSKLKKIWLPVAVSLLAGTTISALSAIIIAAAFGASPQTQLSLAPKATTTPVAMGIADAIGGLPSLTAVLVVLTGMFGALMSRRIFQLLRITDQGVQGIALGIAAHGIGTARAFQVSREMGAFSGLAMALSALVSAVTLPWIIELLRYFPPF